jgi:hypothetical protein
MEEIKNYHESTEEGRRVWAALTSQMGEGAGFFGAMLASFRTFLKRELTGLLVAGLVAAAVGGVYALLQKQTYQAEMTVSYGQLEKKIYADMLYKLEELRSGGEYAGLASVLGISVEQAKKIRRIDSRNIHNEPLVKDVSTQKVPFYVVVDVYDESVLPVLQQALVKYINAPPFVKARLKLNEQNYLDEIAMIRKQMAYMDSLKVLLLKNQREPDGTAVAGLNNLNKSENELFSRVRDLEGALKFNQNIEVMDGFVGHRVPWTKRILPPLFIGFVIGVGIRLSWIILR